MHHTHTLQLVRELIQHRFQLMGVADQSQLSETILIQDGYYCGRRFTCDGVQAIWFAEEGQLKFYCRAGTVVEVCDSPGTANYVREAAA